MVDRKLKSWFGFEKGVGQMDFVNSFEEGIFNKFGIDVKEDGHVHFLVGIQPLLLKAKTLYFVEINYMKIIVRQAQYM